MKISVDASEAKAELRQVEQSVQRVEQAGAKAESPVQKVVQALTGQSAATDKVVKSSQQLDETTRKVSAATNQQWAEMVLAGKHTEAWALVSDKAARSQVQLESAMAAANATRAAGVAGITATSGALSALGIVALAELKFIYEASKAYTDKSGILEQHRKSIDGVKDAWDDLLFLSGQQLVGSGANFNSWINTVEVGLRLLSVVIVERIAEFQQLIGLMQFVMGRGTPTPANALRDVNGNPTAAGYLARQSHRTALEIEFRGADFARPSGAEAQRIFDESERERTRQEAAAQREAERMRQLRERAEQQLRDAMDLDYRLGLTTIPGMQMARPTPPPVPSLPSLDYDFGYLTSLPGQQLPIPVPPTVPPSFFQQAFGSSGQFGQMLSGSILQAITGGGSIGNAIGGTIGSGLGSGLASMLTRGATPVLSGFLGGAANAILPGVGALLGPAIGNLFGKIFGPTAYEQRERAANAQITRMVSDLESQFGGVEGTAFLADKLGIKWEPARQWRGAGSVDPLSGIVNQIQGGAVQGLNDILNAALTTGEQFPAALQPALESLIRMGGLTQENANLLRGLPAAGVPSMREISAAADVLGVDVEALGDKVKQIGLTETAESAAQAWLTLERAGADMSVVAAASAEQMQGFVDQALKYGFTLPESLRPAIENMKELGLISGDIEKIEWAKPISESVNDLIEALRELIAELRGPLPAALDDLDGREINIGVNYHHNRPDLLDGGGPPIDQPELAHTGGFLWNGRVYPYQTLHGGGLAGDEFFIRAQAGEFVMQRSAVQRYGRGFMESVNSGRFGSQPRPLVIPVTVRMTDDSVIAEAVARATVQ